MHSAHSCYECDFEHRCVIEPEKDVLQVDIAGSGFVVWLKRWWNDLFLLSYNDRRSRIYFTSSRNIHMERFRQYRRYRHRIHPLSKFRNMWDCLMLHVFILYKMVFHHNTSVLFGKLFHMFFYDVAIALEIIIIIDLLVNFETGYINEQDKRIVLNAKEGILNYCSTKLFLHCISAIPLQCLMFMRLGDNIDCALSKTNYFVCALRILSVFSLYRVYETSKYWTRAREPSNAMYFFKFLRIGVLGLISMLQLFDISDTICLITTISTGILDRYSYFIALLRKKFSVVGAPPKLNIFCYNFGRICKSFLMFSFEYRMSKYYLDKMTSLIAYFIANIFYMWCLLECYGLMIRRKYHRDQNIITKSLALNLAHYRQLPDETSHKINQFYDFKMSGFRRVEVSNQLYQCLPAVLKRESTLHSYSYRITRLPFFSGWPQDVLEKIVLMLTQDVYLDGDLVADPYVSGDGLVIVDVGELAVYSEAKQETGHLIDGDYFGELSLVTDKEVRMSWVIATTSCKVLILEKNRFRVLMRNYPDLFFSLRRQLMHKYSITEPHPSQP